MPTATDDLDTLRAQLDEAPLAELTGRFHSHLTVAEVPDAAAFDRLCRRHHAKRTVIDLDRFDDRVQRDVMTTRYHQDDAPGALGRLVDDLRAMCADLEAAGLRVLRVKVEHESLPSLPTYGATRYHEVHVKLDLPEDGYDDVMAWLREQAPATGWVPSRNPNERREGRVLQFVTFRCYEGDRALADERVAEVRARLEARGLRIAEIKRETTVLDTRVDHDAWWLSA
ncbi:MAG: hypothetical protein KC621_09270 [Myxococcales bacterium]|nr:hypothetical protein [Myxococcales bacterium]